MASTGAQKRKGCLVARQIDKGRDSSSAKFWRRKKAIREMIEKLKTWTIFPKNLGENIYYSFHSVWAV